MHFQQRVYTHFLALGDTTEHTVMLRRTRQTFYPNAYIEQFCFFYFFYDNESSLDVTALGYSYSTKFLGHFIYVRIEGLLEYQFI